MKKINEVMHEVGLVLWFLRQRMQELAILAITIGAHYCSRTYIDALVPMETESMLPKDVVIRYVVPYAELVFAFVIAIQISIIVWVSGRPPDRVRK